jgi:hypothetical protein
MTFKYFPMLLVVIACSPYEQQRGEFNAGPVDAANFPLPYRGVGGEPSVHGFRAGAGTFTEIRAFIDGSPAGYYSFPFTDRQLMLQDLSDGGTPATNVYPDKDPKTPIAYAFDPSPPNPFPSSQICTPPPNYTYDLRTDDMPLNEQDNIFTQLPWAREQPGIASTFEYIPVVAEVAVTAAGLACQSIKSERRLKKVLGNPPKTGNLLLWAIIDPSSGVYRVGEESTRLLPDAGLNPNYRFGNVVQKWGWFGQYYLAYIDGAYVPFDLVEDRYGIPPTVHTVPRMKTQRLYLPRGMILSNAVQCGGATCQPGQVCAGGSCQTCQSSGQRACPRNFQCGTSGPVMGRCNANAQLGGGYDVLQYRRGDPNYTPVCQVWLYTANTDTPARPMSIAELPKSAADVVGLAGASPAKSSGPPVGATPRPGDPPPRYIYCPQVD